MATIKGQHLRLMLDSYCIAMAQEATLHVQMQTQESSTKDSEDDWVENEIVVANWDASCTAVVTMMPIPNMVTSISIGHDRYIAKDSVHLKAGDTIRVSSDARATKLITNLNKVVLETASETEDLEYIAEDEIDVYVGSNSDNTRMIVNVEDDYAATTTDELINSMKSKEVFTVSLDYTDGYKNRESSKKILRGSAVITDININSQNRQTATATMQLTGVGELEIVDE